MKIIIKMITVLLLMASALACASCDAPTGANTTAQTAAPATENGAETAAVTAADTEVQTAPAAAPETKPETEPATEPAAEPATDPATEPDTDPVTEPVTEPETEPVTEPPTTAAPEPDPPSDTFALENGKKYTADGYDKEKDGAFTIKKGFTVTFEKDAFKDSFNRMSFKYTSDKPLHIYVKYDLSGAEKTDDFYLEAGEGVLFNGLISSYLTGKYGKTLSAVTFDSCTGAAAVIKLSAVYTETVKVYNSKQYYIENDRLKVGIKLSWGGGINYVEDKTCGVSGLKNLINQCDTGRLIQQSYYGTGGNSEYTPGSFNGSKWAYNPVQGGDKYGNASRLIDISVGESSVYVKAQPQDWSLNNQLTRSYMENTYSLDGGVLRVDNRFVDFSGWKHDYRHQELPAFYTVSYLDSFVWYNGVDGWSDDKLTVRGDLPFWGDAQYAESCRFSMKNDNAETWCAWFSSKNDFGIGLYVPNIDQFYAGRYSYNGSKSPTDGATNYVAPLMTLKMVSFTPIEYSYLITTGSVSQIRSVFYESRDFADNASLHKNYVSMRVSAVDMTELDFSKAAARAAVNTPFNTEVSYSGTEKALLLKVSKAHDPQVMIDYSGAAQRPEAADHKTIEIVYMIPNTNSQPSYTCDLFLCTGSKTSPDGSERVRTELIRDGEYHTCTVDLSQLPFWTGTVNRIRFDYFDQCAQGDVIYVRSFSLK